MLIDYHTQLSDQQDIGQAEAAYLSDKSYDIGTPGTPVLASVMGGTVPLNANIGNGNELEALILITEALASSGSATLLVELVQADNEALDSNLEVLAATPAIAYDSAKLAVGKYISLRSFSMVTKRFLGVRYTIGGATTTAGKVSAWIGGPRQTMWT